MQVAARRSDHVLHSQAHSLDLLTTTAMEWNHRWLVGWLTKVWDLRDKIIQGPRRIKLARKFFLRFSANPANKLESRYTEMNGIGVQKLKKANKSQKTVTSICKINYRPHKKKLHRES